MACKIDVHEATVMLVWGTPELHDLQRAEAAISEVHRRHGPVMVISRVPAESPAPNEEFRAVLAEAIPRIMKCVAGFHAVLEGRGFFAAAKRTVLATAFLISGERHRSRIHSSVDEVLLAVEPARRAEVRAALAQFQRNGFCTDGLSPSAAATAG